MKNAFISNSALKNLIASATIKERDKSFLLSQLPNLDLQQRLKLFKALKDIYLLDLEEKEQVEKIKKYL